MYASQSMGSGMGKKNANFTLDRYCYFYNQKTMIDKTGRQLWYDHYFGYLCFRCHCMVPYYAGRKGGASAFLTTGTNGFILYRFYKSLLWTIKKGIVCLYTIINKLVRLTRALVHIFL